MPHIEGFGERGGFGRRPALIVIYMTLGFTDPESPLACDLEGPVAEIETLLDPRFPLNENLYLTRSSRSFA